MGTVSVQAQAFLVVFVPLVVLLPLVNPSFLTPVLLFAAALVPCFPPLLALSAFPALAIDPVLLLLALVLAGDDFAADLDPLPLSFAVDLVTFCSSSFALGFSAAADLALRV